MVLKSFVVPVLIVSLSFWGLSQCKKDPSRSIFAGKVKKDISHETYKKLFATNIKDSDEFVEATKMAYRKFSKIVGSPIDMSLEQQLIDANKKYSDQVKPSIIFNVYTKATALLLTDKGLLNRDNVAKYAKMYAEELEKAAKSLNDGDSIKTTLPTLAGAEAMFLNSLDLSSNAGNEFVKYLIDEINKH